MYSIESFWIAGILLVSMLATIEAGYLFGLRRTKSENESSRAHLNAILGAILGVLALLLGFTFSLSLQRFESRSQAVVDEANAIGTTWLRAQLLPSSVRSDAQDLLRQYVDLRARTAEITLDQEGDLAAELAEAMRIQNALWDHARQAAEADANVVTSGLFIQSLNDLIDSFGRRDAELGRHVPELVLMLLYGTFLMAGLIIGYTAGATGRRASFASYILTGLVVLLVFIIVDLDRPRRGLITVSHKPLTDLQAAVRADPHGTSAAERPKPR